LRSQHLTYAVLFEAGLDGIQKKMERGDPVEQNVYHFADSKRIEMNIETLPSSLKEALEEWKSDDVCVRALGNENTEKFLELKQKKWKEYEPHIPAEAGAGTSWEVNGYLLV